MKAKQPPYFQFIITNQSGLLHYSQAHESYEVVSTNILIGLASRFYSLDNLQSTIVPERAKAIYQKSDLDFINKSRIQDIETSTFRLSVFQSVTGLRFVLITDAETPAKQNQSSLQLIYRAFTDFVLKDPFYSVDSPINNRQFTSEVNKVLERA